MAEAISLQGARPDEPPAGVADSTPSISLRALQRYCERHNERDSKRRMLLRALQRYNERSISLRSLQRYCELADSLRRAAAVPPGDTVSLAHSLDRIMDTHTSHDSIHPDLLDISGLDLAASRNHHHNDSLFRHNDSNLRRYINALLDNDTLFFALFYAIIPLQTEGAKAPLLRLKTNAVGWALLNSNLTVEYGFADHWAVSVPVYYGALDYFSSRVKFRTLTIMPEMRYYTRLDAGLFVGLHAGLCYYNFAIGGTTRFQDHRGKEPALGGGLTAGYILPFGKSRRWNVEYAIGVGVYRHHYDKFYNYKNGPRYADKTQTDLYVDHLAVSLSYNFDLTHRHAHR